MGKGILTAIREVFKNVPLFICHYHFLENVGKELFGEENDTIRKRLKNHGIQGTLRRRVSVLDSKTVLLCRRNDWHDAISIATCYPLVIHF